MSADETLAGYVESDFDYSAQRLARSNAPYRTIERELDAWGLDASWLGDQGPDTEFEKIWRYQYNREFLFPTKKGEDRIEYNPVEFRTYIYLPSEPPRDLRDHIRDDVNPRLVTLFNTGPYAGWLDGYQFQYHLANTESRLVGADEASNLGIPQFEVLVRKDGDVVGSAGGFFDPFGLFEQVPKHEVFNVTRNESRGVYEIRPQSRARERFEGSSKEVYLDGKYVGNISPSRGTVELKFEYSSNDGTWKNRQTGHQMWSRRKLVDDHSTSAQAIRAGGKVYKVNETTNRIVLVGTKAQTPDDFDPTPPDHIPESMIDESVLLDINDAETEFVVRTDSGSQLGKYTPPRVRSIEEKTTTNDFDTEPYMG